MFAFIDFKLFTRSKSGFTKDNNRKITPAATGNIGCAEIGGKDKIPRMIKVEKGKDSARIERAKS